MGFAEFINNNITKGVLATINIISIIVFYVYIGVEGANPDVKEEFRGRIGIIALCSVLVMLTWWGLSISMFASTPESTTYYMFFMVAFLLALSFIAISITSMSKM